MQLATLLRTLGHTRPSQLAHRARLTLKRRLHEAAGLRLLARSLESQASPRAAEVPPSPVFAARSALVERDARGVWARCADRRMRLHAGAPLEWHPRDWAQGTRLAKLHLHYMEFAEGLDAQEFARAADDWIAHNAPRRGYWLDHWSAFALSIRAVVWMQQAARWRAELEPAFWARLERSLAAQLRFLERNLELDLGGNHLVKNVKALLWAARFFEPGRDSARWSALGRRLLGRVLGEQMLADGMHFERSPTYHAQVTADLLECAAVLEPGRLRARLDLALARALQVAVDLAHPDGLPALFNDGGLAMAYAPAELARAWVAQGHGAPAPRARFAFPDAGYFGARWGADYLVADCGSIGPDELPAHAHGDVGSFEWSLAGQRLIVDAGVHGYDPGALRRAARASASHNVATLDDQDQAEFWSSFRAGRRPRVRVLEHRETRAGLELAGTHDGYAHLRGAPRVERRIAAAQGALEVSDRVHGGAGQRVRARLLLHPDVRAAEEPDGWVLWLGELRVRLATDARVHLEQAAWYPNIGECLPTRRLVLDYGPAPTEGSFALALAAAAAAAPRARRAAMESARELGQS